MISVVIPAYNESERIIGPLLDIDRYFRKQKSKYEIIVVNDGSKDNTELVVKQLMVKIKNLKIINNPENEGKGYSVRTGMTTAKGDYILFMDADGSTSIREIKKVLPYLKGGYDIVIGSRQIAGSQIISPKPAGRRVLGDVFGFMVRTITGVKGFCDTQCGFKAFSADAAKKIMPKCKISRWAFDPEILAIAINLKYKIKEVPVIWTYSPKSKVNFKGMAQSVVDLFKIRWNLINKKYE
jgi:dolichyl-phosphate beta-glucosyltransferase